MTQRPALTVAQRESVYYGKLNGRSLMKMANELGCSYTCARKWWRVGRRAGPAGLRRPRASRGRPPALSTFAALVAERALACKRQHPRRGATRIMDDLAHDPLLAGQRLPK